VLLNATMGWAWADPVVGIVIAWLAAREGREAWLGEECSLARRDGPSHARPGTQR
jgi:hypothetical protein